MSSLEVVLEGPRGRAELLDRYVEFVAARCRRNTVIATVSDLRVFFAVIDKDPAAVTPADVFEFISTQRRGDGDGRVVRLVDGEAGMAARTIRRRLAVMSGLFNWLVLCGEMGANPVPRGMATRRSGAGGQPSGSPLIRTPRTLPKVLDPADVIALLGAARHWRDRAMLEAMVLGGLRCCEVIGLRLEDLQPTQRLVFIADGKGGHQRLIPMSGQFFQSLSHYLSTERPADATTDAVFVALKGARRGGPLSIDGLEQIVRAAKGRAGLERATCHQLRHTCLTRLREAGMALEAIQAQAGHRSIESTRVYLHLADGWLASEYQRASDLIDASVGVLK
ncbi:MAG: tyrosine-type recombinase/integrase [Actinobacteria bacterium]|jgi:site-specific recombinase XerD|nr:tyrosine-type recombinase/integrase [Acidimicrobiaceae bacterium]MBK9972728.1 tyrosine-type recombinase/integrase [Acidimicrobiaceae bacterium]NMD24453.1 tyrosine-type recombinase/integrase [Actinomycetota bacterium]